MSAQLLTIRDDLLKLTDLHRQVIHRARHTQFPNRDMLADAKAAIEQKVPGWRVYYLFHEDAYVLLPTDAELP